MASDQPWEKSMKRIMPVVCGMFAMLVLALTADPALADCMGGGKRGAPTRSTVGGLGVGFAGIGMAWGATWIGFRLVGRMFRK